MCIYYTYNTYYTYSMCMYIYTCTVCGTAVGTCDLKCQIGINGHLQKISLYKLKGRTWMCSGVVYCGVAIPFFV